MLRKKTPGVDITLEKIPGVAVENKEAFRSNLLWHLQALHLFEAHVLRCLEKFEALQGKSEARTVRVATAICAKKGTVTRLKGKAGTFVILW